MNSAWRVVKLGLISMVLALPITACDGDTGGGLDAQVADDAARSDAETGGAPFITDAFDCVPNPGNGVMPGSDLFKVTLSGENVQCNDGSPAVIYIRRAATPADEANWVFHLQGGGGCGGADCMTRWCDRNEKMSSLASPPSMEGKGIMRREPRNSLGHANQVYLYYCSSDNWAGTAGEARIDATDASPEFRLLFNGQAIVSAALDALEAGVTSDDGSQTLPSLSGDGWALWTGTSGGCQGVANTADAVSARLRARGLSPWIICDANFSPTLDDLPPSAMRDAYVEARRERYRLSSVYAGQQLDASCVSGNPGDDAYLCAWPGYVLSHHVVDAPLFVRMSLADNTIADGFTDVGYSTEEFAMGVRAAMLRTVENENNERAPRPVSMYGPGCSQHVGLTNDAWFLETTIEVEGTPVTFHDAVVAWMDGRDVVAVDTVPPTLSVCGETTDDTH